MSTIQDDNKNGKITSDAQKLRAIAAAIEIFKYESKDEFLLVHLITNYFNKKNKLKDLYMILTNEKWKNDDEPALFNEAEPKSIRKSEGNTKLDLSMGALKYRTNGNVQTQTGIEFDENFDKKNLSFLFCEAKWESDISINVSYCSKRNQFQRIIENAIYFTNSENCQKIFVTLLTPEKYFPNPFYTFGSRLYHYKFIEYKNNIETLRKELKEVELEMELTLRNENNEKGGNTENKTNIETGSYEKYEKNILKLELNWITFENLIRFLSSIEPNFESYIYSTVYGQNKKRVSIPSILENLQNHEIFKFRKNIKEDIKGIVKGLIEIKDEKDIKNIPENIKNMSTSAKNMSENVKIILENTDNISEDIDDSLENIENISKDTDNNLGNIDNLSENMDDISENVENILENVEDIKENRDIVFDNMSDISENAENFSKGKYDFENNLVDYRNGKIIIYRERILECSRELKADLNTDIDEIALTFIALLHGFSHWIIFKAYVDKSSIKKIEHLDCEITEGIVQYLTSYFCRTIEGYGILFETFKKLNEKQSPIFQKYFEIDKNNVTIDDVIESISKLKGELRKGLKINFSGYIDMLCNIRDKNIDKDLKIK